MPSVFADDHVDIIMIKPPTPPPLPPKKWPGPTDPVPPSIVAPTEAPTGISPEKPLPNAGWEDSKMPIGVIDGNFDTKTFSSPPPVETTLPTPVRVGGVIRPPQRLREVNPVYPPIAQAARVQGIVIIEATIGEDGQVTNARILRSVPLLDQAALDAVRQWQYMPTMLNGVPVPVIMTVTVNFTLK